MTDTTDVKALRERMMQQREAALTGNTPSFEDCELLVCDLLRALTLSNKQLEAERQRSDAVPDHVITIVNQQTEILELTERAEKAEARVKELKGDQVPYGYVVRHHHEPEGTGSMIKAGDLEYYKYRGDYHYTELFTAPQKPVVLPSLTEERFQYYDEHNDITTFDEHAYEAAVIAEIQAVGGIVKDGE